MRKILPFIIGGSLLLAFGLFFLFSRSGSTPAPAIIDTNYNPATLPGLQTTTPLWGTAGLTLRDRLKTMGFPLLRTEGNVLHTHQHLDILISGQRVVIPSDIGIDPDQQFIAPIHTHDTTGIIHIESPFNYDFTLGQFFDIWGVRFDDNCLGSVCTDNHQVIRLYQNGQPVSGSFRSLKLQPRQEIFISVDSKTAPPPTPVATYNFPADY